MSVRLVSPREAGERVAAAITQRWAAAVCAEVADAEPFRATVRLRPGVRTSSDVASLGFDRWHDWAQSWHDVAAEGLPGVEVGTTRIVVERVPDQVAAELVVTGLDAALALARRVGAAAPEVDLDRARTIARDLGEAGAVIAPATLRSVARLADVDVRVLVRAVTWLAEHPDLSGSTARQVRAPDSRSSTTSGASILMDVMAAQRYAHLGVSTDKDGRAIPPSSTHLPHLTADETAAYHLVATAGRAAFRRIEQERLPESDAQAALSAVLTPD